MSTLRQWLCTAHVSLNTLLSYCDFKSTVYPYTGNIYSVWTHIGRERSSRKSPPLASFENTEAPTVWQSNVVIRLNWPCTVWTGRTWQTGRTQEIDTSLVELITKPLALRNASWLTITSTLTKVGTSRKFLVGTRNFSSLVGTTETV